MGGCQLVRTGGSPTGKGTYKALQLAGTATVTPAPFPPRLPAPPGLGRGGLSVQRKAKPLVELERCMSPMSSVWLRWFPFPCNVLGTLAGHLSSLVAPGTKRAVLAEMT